MSETACEIENQPRGWAYAAGVRLSRRATSGPSAAAGIGSVDELEAWLLSEAMSETDMLPIIERFVWSSVAAGLPIDRLSVHAGTLHPQLVGIGWVWRRIDGAVEEIQVEAMAGETDGFKLNPIRATMIDGETVRVRPAQELDRWPIARELHEIGITDYIIAPIGRGPGGQGAKRYNAASIATQCENGFTEHCIAAIHRLIRLLALHVERCIQLRLATTVLDTYLGAAAGRRVIEGAIQRGAGERLSAVVWMADLRGFTALSGRLSPEDLLRVLDAAFDAMAGAVLDAGGEVLKFMGDGVLALFETDGAPGEEREAGFRRAAEAALGAAEAAQEALDRLNETPPPEIAEIEGWRPLRAGVAIHAGDVFFGNVGAPDRLDFTVIGPAVNAVSRVEGLCKELGEPVLLSGPVAAGLPERALRPLGDHALRGVGAPLSIHAP